MSANKIVSSQLIKTIKNSGKNIKLKYATKTEAWDRTYLAQSVQEDFGKAVEKADVPAGATTAILARMENSEKEHPSSSDSKNHFTTVYEDDSGNHIATKHVYP
ncbi:hypothetical protein AOQ84DRAFT_396452 [Glonium stellatum]|uniref:Uncharacterized protein n=1 Tax=Glonium stellatum TaxID=574774 RepID=A0A8E2F6N5_9PEZI|nr:hypothetical protein AOQ84DRAFT_396452 [Glonium stellatum]